MFMRARFEESAVRLLKNIFRTGLFENPYLDPEESKNTAGKAEFMKEGYDAQFKKLNSSVEKTRTMFCHCKKIKQFMYRRNLLQPDEIFWE